MKTIFGYLGVLVLFVLVFAIDYLTGSNIGFSGYYFLVIATAVWYLGDVTGYIIAVAAILCRTYVFVYGQVLPNVEIFSVLVDAGSSSLIMFSFTFLLIKIKSQVATLRKMAKTDSLTGAQTSAAFQEQVDLELNRAKRYLHPLSLIFLDIDDFKKVNDTYGHIVGDKLLHKLALSILSALRKNDCLGRLGGDEFAVMLVETNPEQVKAVTKKLQNAIASTSKALKIPLSCSMGAVTVMEGKDIEPKDVLCKADEAMYAIKKMGKNSVHYLVLP